MVVDRRVRLIGLYIQGVLAVLMVTAGLLKLSGQESFARTLGALRVPGEWIALLSVTIPAIEVACSVLLLIPNTMKIGALMVAVVMVLFAVVTIGVIRSNLTISCNCFGQLSTEQFGWSTLMRISTFFAAATYLVSAEVPQSIWSLTTNELLHITLSAIGLLLTYQVVRLILQPHMRGKRSA